MPPKISAKSILHPNGWDYGLHIEKRDRKVPIALTSAFQTSSWIWTAETNPPNAPGLDCAFRNTFISPMKKMATSAMILLSVDDHFSLYVNGNLIGTTPTTRNNWEDAHIYDVTLAATKNVFAILGTNLPNVDGSPSPAGVLAAIQISFSDGSTSMLSSSSGWRATEVIPSGFESLSFDDSQWSPASALFKYGEGPWLSNVILPTEVTSLPMDNASTTTLSIPISLTSTTWSTMAPAATNNVIPGVHRPVGAIVGGVVGGTIFLLIALVYLCRKRYPRCGPLPLLSQPLGLKPENRISLHPGFHIEMVQPRISMLRGSQHLSHSTSSVVLSTITPSMSVSRVGQNQRNDVAEFRDRTERLEGLVVELDTEVSSGGGDPQVAELRGRLAEELTEQSRDSFSGGGLHDGGVRIVLPTQNHVRR
ncbi:hypothetical protein BDZ94DRAFT_1304698 [Collybia nuda]|uniref:Lectin n=1 Tax=Collybia nuda TaxID=64659 RepID=A0A9P6CPX4_9AGAR|nr:hypothetical protein BDZ94DRAFT_1304698 [Collybia nuda]